MIQRKMHVIGELYKARNVHMFQNRFQKTKRVAREGGWTLVR